MDFSVDSLELDHEQDEGRKKEIDRRDRSSGTASERTGSGSRSPSTPPPPQSAASLPDVSSLSPWEKWIVKKAQEELRSRHAQRKKLQEQEEEQCREKQHSQRQKVKSEQCYRDWLAGKAAQEQRRRAALQRMTNRKKAEELQKCQLLREKSGEKFTEWCKKKEAEVAAVKRQQADKEEQMTQLRTERKERANKAYGTWLERTNSSFMHTGYHYNSSADLPTFQNPQPWIGPLDSSESRCNKSC